jgi:hypothetical protein
MKSWYIVLRGVGLITASVEQEYFVASDSKSCSKGRTTGPRANNDILIVLESGFCCGVVYSAFDVRALKGCMLSSITASMLANKDIDLVRVWRTYSVLPRQMQKLR